MHPQTRSRVLVAVAAVALCGACGGGVSGRYVGKGETFLDSITFVSDERVQVVFIGQTREDTYVLDGSTVTITAPNGQRSAFTVGSDGCLTNQLLGTYCKDGAAAPAPAEASSPARGGAEVFEATAREGRIRLEFGVARKAQITMMPENLADAPERMSFDVSYEVSGDDITVNLPGNESLRLTRSGEDLEGTMNGETVRFVRR